MSDFDCCDNGEHDTEPAELSTPQLVREHVANRQMAARGERTTNAQHNRHGAVVAELRARGVLDWR